MKSFSLKILRKFRVLLLLLLPFIRPIQKQQYSLLIYSTNMLHFISISNVAPSCLAMAHIPLESWPSASECFSQSCLFWLLCCGPWYWHSWYPPSWDLFSIPQEPDRLFYHHGQPVHSAWWGTWSSSSCGECSMSLQSALLWMGCGSSLWEVSEITDDQYCYVLKVNVNISFINEIVFWKRVLQIRRLKQIMRLFTICKSQTVNLWRKMVRY